MDSSNINDKLKVGSIKPSKRTLNRQTPPKAPASVAAETPKVANPVNVAEAPRVNSSAVVLGQVLKYLDGLASPPADAVPQAENGAANGNGVTTGRVNPLVQLGGVAKAGANSRVNGVGRGMHQRTKAMEKIQTKSPALEYYFYRRSDGLTEEQFAEWMELVARMESLEVIVSQEAKKSPVRLLQDSGTFIKLATSLNDLTIAAEKEKSAISLKDPTIAAEGGLSGPIESVMSKSVGTVASDISYKGTSQKSTEPFPEYDEDVAQALLNRPDSPLKMPVRSRVACGRPIPPPTNSITFGHDVFVPFDHDGQCVPGYHVHIADIQKDGTNLFQQNGGKWLELRIVREAPRFGGGSYLTSRPSPIAPPPGLPSPMGHSPMAMSPAFPPPGLPTPLGHSPMAMAPAFPLGLPSPYAHFAKVPQFNPAGLGISNLQGHPAAFGFGGGRTVEEPTVFVRGNHYTLISGGVLKGCYASRQGRFLFAGMEWVKELLVVPVYI